MSNLSITANFIPFATFFISLHGSPAHKAQFNKSYSSIVQSQPILGTHIIAPTIIPFHQQFSNDELESIYPQQYTSLALSTYYKRRGETDTSFIPHEELPYQYSLQQYTQDIISNPSLQQYISNFNEMRSESNQPVHNDDNEMKFNILSLTSIKAPTPVKNGFWLKYDHYSPPDWKVPGYENITHPTNFHNQLEQCQNPFDFKPYSTEDLQSNIQHRHLIEITTMNPIYTDQDLQRSMVTLQTRLLNTIIILDLTDVTSVNEFFKFIEEMYSNRFYAHMVDFQSRPLHIFLFGNEHADSFLIPLQNVIDLCTAVGFNEPNIYIFQYGQSNDECLTTSHDYTRIQEFIWHDFWSIYFTTVNEFNTTHQEVQQKRQQSITTLETTFNNNKLIHIQQLQSFYQYHYKELEPIIQDPSKLLQYLQSYYSYIIPISIPKWPHIQQHITDSPSCVSAMLRGTCYNPVEIRKYVTTTPSNLIMRYLNVDTPFNAIFAMKMSRNEHFLYPTPKPMSFDNYSYDTLTERHNIVYNNNQDIKSTSILSSQFMSQIQLLQPQNEQYVPQISKGFRFATEHKPMSLSNKTIIALQKRQEEKERYLDSINNGDVNKTDSITQIDINNDWYDQVPIEYIQNDGSTTTSTTPSTTTSTIITPLQFLPEKTFPNTIHFNAAITIDRRILQTYQPTRGQLEFYQFDLKTEMSKMNKKGKKHYIEDITLIKKDLCHPSRHSSYSSIPNHTALQPNNTKYKPMIFGGPYIKQSLQRADIITSALFGRTSSQLPLKTPLPGPNPISITPHHFSNTTFIPKSELYALLHGSNDNNNNTHTNNQSNIISLSETNDKQIENDENCTIKVTNLFRHDALDIPLRDSTTIWSSDNFIPQTESLIFYQQPLLYGIRIMLYEFTRGTDDIKLVPNDLQHIYPYNGLYYSPPKFQPNNTNNNNDINFNIPLLHNPAPIQVNSLYHKRQFPFESEFYDQNTRSTSLPPFSTIHLTDDTPVKKQYRPELYHLKCPLHLIVICLNPIDDTITTTTTSTTTSTTNSNNSQDLYDPITTAEFNYLQQRITREYKQQLIDIELSDSILSRDECNARWTVDFIQPSQWNDLYQFIHDQAIAIRMKQFVDAMK